ncbi:MAG: integrase family protein [Rhodocyclaceae bacterium]|nr:integrase family protein [Rhodocyclaceae bacterium]
MARIRLTAGRIRDFACNDGEGQSFLWDTDAPGLGIRATANGAKSYIFQARQAGKSIRITIGDVKSWAIESGDAANPGARERARQLQTMIDQGIDPRQAHAEQIAQVEVKRVEAQRRDVTVGEAWPIYIEARRQKWGTRSLLDHQNIADAGGYAVKRGAKGQRKEPGALASMLPVLLSDVTKGRVKAWLRIETARRPTQAALAFRLLRAFLNWCNDTPVYAGLAAEDACSARMAKENLTKQIAKKDCLQREQLSAWFAAVRKIKNPVIAIYLQTLLLTGPRREELAGLKWTEVDFQWSSLTIRDKVDGERVIPLPPYVHSLLSELKRINNTPPKVKKLRGKELPAPKWKPSPWVFSSGAAASGRLQEPSIQHRKACAIAGIEGMTLHGLRRSFGTLAEWVEAPDGVVKQIQGHKPSGTAEKHYRQRPLDLLRMWHTKIESWMLSEAGIEFKSTHNDGRVAKRIS